MPPTDPTARTVKVPHLVVAVLFLGTAATWLLLATGVLGALALPYALPSVLVVAGVLGLVAVAAGARRRTPAPGTVEAPVPHHDQHEHRHDDRPHDPLDELDDDGGEPTAPVTPTRRLTADPTPQTEDER